MTIVDFFLTLQMKLFLSSTQQNVCLANKPSSNLSLCLNIKQTKFEHNNVFINSL